MEQWKHSFPFNPKLVQGDIQILTELAHLHLQTNLEMYNRFESVQQELYELERKIIDARLHSLASTENQYALLRELGPGYEVFVQGEVAYIIKCKPLKAKLVDYPNCMQEIPIRVNNQTGFADPMTRVLHDFPAVVPCSQVMLYNSAVFLFFWKYVTFVYSVVLKQV